MILDVPIKINVPIRTYTHHIGNSCEMVTSVFHVKSGPVIINHPKNPNTPEGRRFWEWMELLLKHLKEEIHERESRIGEANKRLTIIEL